MKAKRKPNVRLNPSQRRFVREYLKDQNATQAYLRVYGGKTSSADTCGPRLLGNVRIKLAIEKGLARLAERANITAEKNLRRLAQFAYEGRVKTADAIKACELIGKSFGQFKEVTENKHEVAVAATEEQVNEAAKKLLEKL